MTDYLRDPNSLTIRDPHNDWGSIAVAHLEAAQGDIARLASMALTPPYFQDRVPSHQQLAFEPLGHLDDTGAVVEWGDPDRIVIRSFSALVTDLETLELAVGTPIVQLCDRQIPARGVE